MITLDLSTLKTSRVDDVVYMNSSLCDYQVCTLPSDIDTRHVNQDSNNWSFLFKRALNREVYWLLGFGGSPVTDRDGAWGFSWLPQQLSSSSFTDLNITGIKTVTAVTKEYAAPIAYIRENIPYIVGIRSSKTGKSFCTGILVTKYLVLTAAHCMKRDEIRYVAFSAMNGPPRPNFGETIPVSYTIKPLSYRVERTVVGGNQKEVHYNNFLLVQLAYEASRAPIQLITGDPEKVEGEIKNATEATSFGLTIEDNLETLRLTTVSLLSGNDTCERLLNETALPPDGSTVCIDGEAKSACPNEAGDGGNPLVVLRGSVFARLIAIGSAGVACQPGKRYSSYTRIYGINPFLNKYMNQLPIPVTSAPAPTKKT
ncbi:hypothetical protein Poli38472_011479 [Pythium oligandrum]|uniref:Peptidase S1 domain-containing protein n=1 Tax=Pythium oligandrum TaxID=41045 RepID=A0A8K1CJ98_PYTOL|nr:hypothetical protein Poli38472_011479 [Pythium oligandrum]|eukprot:TMW64599.1 hypothetical protein Poli38472_011479 [Pythium oligandrum]